MGALGPLGKVAGARGQWLRQVTAYTMAGMVTSALVGAGLGWLGRAVVPDPLAARGIPLALAVGAAAMARELGWVRVPLPQLRRQTRDVWGKVFPGVVAAVLWGLDLGLFFTTYFTFAGLWLLVMLGLLGRDAGLAAGLFVAYWLGRALSVWLVPLLMPDAGATPRLLEALAAQYGLFRRIHAAALAWALIVLVLLWITGTGA